VGTRGIPDVQGGVERHCAELYPRLVDLGAEVVVFGREGYCESGEYRGVTVRALPAPRGKGVEALLHTRLAIQAAAGQGFDIIHVHSVGPALLVPYARRVSPRSAVVFTLHAPDYEQRKWGRFARWLLKTGERRGVRGADAVISVSAWLAERAAAEYGVEPVVIPNGPGENPFVSAEDDAATLGRFGLEPGDYVLFVGRLIPDKRVEDLFAACALLPGMPRVAVVGGSSDAPAYEAELAARAPAGTVFTGALHGSELGALYRGARCMVLPSAVEGLPVTLVEAMSAGVPVVASDIAANVEVLGADAAAVTYPVGDVRALADVLGRVLSDGELRSCLVADGRARAEEVFGWERIAEDTYALLERVYAEKPRGV